MPAMGALPPSLRTVIYSNTCSGSIRPPRSHLPSAMRSMAFRACLDTGEAKFASITANWRGRSREADSLVPATQRPERNGDLADGSPPSSKQETSLADHLKHLKMRFPPIRGLSSSNPTGHARRDPGARVDKGWSRAGHSAKTPRTSDETRRRSDTSRHENYRVTSAFSLIPRSALCPLTALKAGEPTRCPDTSGRQSSRSGRLWRLVRAVDDQPFARTPREGRRTRMAAGAGRGDRWCAGDRRPCLPESSVENPGG